MIDMSKVTENLNLFKYEKDVDADKTFNIDEALNKNWDIVDKEVSKKQNSNDIAKSIKLHVLSIPAQSWSNKEYSYAVPDYNPDKMYCEPAFADYDSQTAWGKSAIFVSDDKNESGTIVFTCNKDIPTVTLSLILKVGVLA